LVRAFRGKKLSATLLDHKGHKEITQPRRQP
jgi:hypothetical protein